MTSAHLPSTLVRCLYLFFDLPTVSDSTPSADAIPQLPGANEEQAHSRSQTSANLEPAVTSPPRYSFLQGPKARSTTERPTPVGKKSGSDYLMAFANTSVAEKRNQLQKVFVRVSVSLSWRL